MSGVASTEGEAGRPKRADRPDPGLRRWGWFALATAVATWAVIVLGGVVRITESGMGCGPDWPLCHGQLIPTMDLETFLEWFHRLVAGVLGLMIVGAAAWAWWPGRGAPWKGARRLMAVAVPLLVVQVLLGAVTVRLHLPPATVILHFAVALGILGALLAATCQALRGGPVWGGDSASGVAWLTVGFGLLVTLLGGKVANLDAAMACVGFPLCNQALWPAGEWPIQLHWIHRLTAYLLVGWLLYLPFHFRRRLSPGAPGTRAAYWAAGLGVAQIVVAAAMVLLWLPDALQALHLAVGVALFGALVVTAVLVASEAPEASKTPAAAEGAEARLEGAAGTART